METYPRCRLKYIRQEPARHLLAPLSLFVAVLVLLDDLRGFLDRWDVRPLFSPPYTPEYNGSIEAGNGALKTRTHEEAARQGRDGPWTADDVEAARRMANELTYPHGPLGPTRQERLGASPRISLEARAAFGRSVEHEQTQERLKQDYPLDTDLGHAAQAQIDRAAIRRALVEHGYLTFTHEVNYSIN